MMFMVENWELGKSQAQSVLLRAWGIQVAKPSPVFFEECRVFVSGAGVHCGNKLRLASILICEVGRSCRVFRRDWEIL